MLKRQTYNKGDPIITEGEEGDTLHILNRGSVRILRNTLDRESFALVNLDAGQSVFFGEIALIDSDRRSATVIALTDCETLTLSRQDYLSLCEEDPYIGYKITFRIATRIAESLRKSSSDLMTLYQALVEEIS
ncbi:MAG TPA: cyclic nucleotide-binding domain-containing protein [Treponemataceae bacterium]|nr:cyclic nucleotide-binding domain-containing protein [Treponemataceae bacterium]